MGANYLIDTNTIVYLLDKKLPSTAESFLAEVIDDVCQLSVISQIELLSWQTADLPARATPETFVAECQIIDLSAAVVQRTIQLRQIHKIKLPDAVIDATALANN